MTSPTSKRVLRRYAAKTLTVPQARALLDFAKDHGSFWQMELLEGWNGKTWLGKNNTYLWSIRDDFGPKWLRGVTMEEIEQAAEVVAFHKEVRPELVKGVQESAQRIAGIFEDIDKYLKGGATREMMRRGLGKLATAERLTSGLRAAMEDLGKP